MLDIKALRQDPDAVNRQLARRSPDLSITDVLELDKQRLALLQEEETLRSERNQLTKTVAEQKKAGQDATEALERSRAVGDRIKAIEAEKAAIEEQQQQRLLTLPNLPDVSTPDGLSEADNVEVRRWGDAFKDRVPQEVKAHWEIGPELGLLDFERGVKVAKSRFSVFRGAGALLARALINFMLDQHREAGYEEIAPPLLVNAATLQGTGQLPKFEADLFKLADEALYLIPTAEVPVTNLYAGEVLAEEELPKYFVAYTPCFRSEAGAAGRDTRGLIRQHQFDKVELVKVVHPQDSEEAHEQMTRDAEAILQALELPYRVMSLCTGDLGFSAQKCYDLEVWMPSQGVYREISSASNMGTFQARRMNLRFKPADGGKADYVHTMNASALAVGRTVAAILENYQRSDNSIQVPLALQAYMHLEEIRLEPYPTSAPARAGASS